jgi:hypothetical protein
MPAASHGAGEAILLRALHAFAVDVASGRQVDVGMDHDGSSWVVGLISAGAPDAPHRIGRGLGGEFGDRSVDAWLIVRRTRAADIGAQPRSRP